MNAACVSDNERSTLCLFRQSILDTLTFSRFFHRASSVEQCGLSSPAINVVERPYSNNQMKGFDMKVMTVTLLALFAFGTLAGAASPTEGLPESVLEVHRALTSDCQDDFPSGPETYDLGHGKKLFMVPCIMGAYQGSYNAYIASGENNKDVTPVMVFAYDEMLKAVVATTDLTEASYDPVKKTLHTFAKGRGIGDCGQTSTSKIVVDQYGAVVKTVNIRAKVECDGKMNAWPVVFKQN